MKLTKITSMMAAAVAVGFCMSAAAGDTGAGKDGKFNLNNYETQFTVSASALTPTSGGTWANQPITDAGTIVIDCEPSSSNEFTYAVTTDPMVQCDFRLSVSPVPVTTEAPNPSTPDGGAQVAFCISTNTAAGGASVFRAYANGWKTLAGFNLNGATTYDLRITFDYKSGKYAKFSVKTTEASSYTDLVDTTDSTTKWFATGKDAVGVSQYCFIGDGALTSFSTAQADIATETVPVADAGNVNVPESVVTNIVVPSGSTLAAELAKPDSSGGNKVIDNVVLGLRTEKGLVDGGNLVASNADVGSSDTTKIKLGLNATPPEGTGASVSYQLYGSNTGEFGGEETPVGSSTNDPAAVSIPLSGATIYKYYKVKATITYAD